MLIYNLERREMGTEIQGRRIAQEMIRNRFLPTAHVVHDNSAFCIANTYNKKDGKLLWQMQPKDTYNNGE